MWPDRAWRHSCAKENGNLFELGQTRLFKLDGPDLKVESRDLAFGCSPPCRCIREAVDVAPCIWPRGSPNYSTG